MLEQLNASLTLIISQTKQNYHILEMILLIIWSVFGLVLITKGRLLYLGIIPRRLIGLPGIIFAPFLHANFNHIFFNSIPLVVLGNFILIDGLNYFIYVTIAIILQSGILIWCFAKPAIHVGASSLITGYWGILACNIVQNGSVTAIILGVISLYYFAGIFFGIFPSKKGVSWEGHLFGLIAGIATNWEMAHGLLHL